MAHLDFDAARKERLREREQEHVSFGLGGRVFRCRTSFPLIDVWSDAPPAPAHIEETTTTAAGRFFLNLARTLADFVIPEQRGDFWAMFEDDTEIIQGVDLQNVLDGLREEYAGRPTSPSDASSNGQRTEPNGSTSSSTPATTSGGTSST